MLCRLSPIAPPSRRGDCGVVGPPDVTLMNTTITPCLLRQLYLSGLPPLGGPRPTGHRLLLRGLDKLHDPTSNGGYDLRRHLRPPTDRWSLPTHPYVEFRHVGDGRSATGKAARRRCLGMIAACDQYGPSASQIAVFLRTDVVFPPEVTAWLA